MLVRAADQRVQAQRERRRREQVGERVAQTTVYRLPLGLLDFRDIRHHAEHGRMGTAPAAGAPSASNPTGAAVLVPDLAVYGKAPILFELLAHGAEHLAAVY